MIVGLFEQELIAYLTLGLLMNFLFSLLFGYYLSQNIGLEEMMLSKGDKVQPWWMPLTLGIPYLKMLITLYRVAVLQIYFLNQGRSHKEYWVYMTTEQSEV